MPALKPDAYSTHLAPLARCIVSTSGPVLELGAGLYSTPLLHALCLDRFLLSLESQMRIVQYLHPFLSPRHLIKHVADWDAVTEIEDDRWSVVLVDHEPAERRAIELRRLSHKIEFIVVHDAEIGIYGLKHVLSGFRYVRAWRTLEPCTVIVSDVRDPKDIWNDANHGVNHA